MRCGLGLGIDRAALSPVLAEAAARLGGVLPVAFSSAPPSAFPGQFDLVMSHEVVYLLPDLEAAFGGLHASLRGGGVVAMATGCHIENALYPRWQESFARVGVRAYPYRVSDYTRALEAAGFEGIEHRSLRLALEEYEEWVATREERTPNPSWFPTPDEERRYYTEFGKALLLARRRRDDGTAASARPTSRA